MHPSPCTEHPAYTASVHEALEGHLPLLVAPRWGAMAWWTRFATELQPLRGIGFPQFLAESSQLTAVNQTPVPRAPRLARNILLTTC